MATEDTKKIIYSMVRVGKTFGTKKVLSDISLSLYDGAKIGILGLNGSGKSTLLKIIAGVEKSYLGEIHCKDAITIGYLPQEPELDPEKTVKEIVSEGVQQIVNWLQEFDAINLKFAEDMTPEEMEKLIAKQAEIQDKLDRVDAWTLDDRLNFAMGALSCPPSDALVKNLSGGERVRVALCRLLLQEPDVLLLDEPTNHLDANSVGWLEQHLDAYKGTVIAVTHDRYFLDNVAGWILELDRGEGYPYKGNYSGWLKQKQERLAIEEKTDDRRIKTLQRELEWVNMSPKARQAKSKSRLNSYDELLAQKQSEVIQDLRIFIPPGPRLGNVVIEASQVSKSFEGKTLYKDLSFSLPRAGIVGIVGPNGSGKTTLFKMISGEETPDEGTFKIGSTVKLGYMKQSRYELDPNKTVYEMISQGYDVVTVGKNEVNARAYVSQFNFTGQDQQKKIGVLSGGERNRVQLALLLKEEFNVILLDEPSNDLDINTLRSLEDAILNYAGCVVVISHDRWFLDRVATHILSFSKAGEVHWCEGNYSEYEEKYLAQGGKSDAKNNRYQGISR